MSEFGSIDLPPSQLSALTSTARLLERDTSLFYSTLLILSRQSGKVHHTPVLLYPVTLSSSATAELPELQVEHSRAFLNPALYHLFGLPAQFENKLTALLPTGELNLATPGLLAQDLAEHIPGLDASSLAQFPTLMSHQEVKAIKSSDKPLLLPASALILSEKSKNVAGLLHELKDLLDEPLANFPPALSALLGHQPSASKTSPKTKKTPHLAPTLLSPAQENLLRSAEHHPLTVCHGPPGTGKSYTVSAAALDQAARGHSVLIACRSEEAAAVIEDKLSELNPQNQLVVRAGRSQHLKGLKSLIDQLIARRAEAAPSSNSPEKALRKKDSLLSKSSKELAKRQQSESRAGSLFSHSSPPGWWQKVRRWNHRRLLKRTPLLCELLREIMQEQNQRLSLLRLSNQQRHQRCLHLHASNEKSREVLKRYRKAIGRRLPTSQERELLELDLTTLTQFLPIWITTTDDIHRILPLKPALFDLVIMDEATQCDLASALPILYRGKRAIVTGDPHQLRHLSFLSNERLQNLADQHQLSPQSSLDYHFRKVSLLDRAIIASSESDSMHFLDEHFRSLPPLIAFSNQHFYQDRLHCMREVETLGNPNAPSPFTIHTTAGKRDKQGVNQEEIAAAIDYLQQLVSQETGTHPSSLGFLSPFRNQVDAFLKQFQTKLTPPVQQRLLRDHQFIVGTAYSFQGSERDIILLSLVLDDESPPASRRYLERADVFNVSITRARQQVQIFASVQASELPFDSILRGYLLHASEHTPSNKLTSRSTPPLPSDLIARLASLGWQHLATTTQVAGVAVDLLFQKSDTIIAIDLIGTLNELGETISAEKALLLARAGLPLYPLSIAEWHCRSEEFLTKLPQKNLPLLEPH